MYTHHGHRIIGTDVESLPVIATAYVESTGMEHTLYRDADGRTIIGSCHEDVGLMRYWSGDNVDELVRFANIGDVIEWV